MTKEQIDEYEYISLDLTFFAIMFFLLKNVILIFSFKKPFLENGLESPLIFVLF